MDFLTIHPIKTAAGWYAEGNYFRAAGDAVMAHAWPDGSPEIKERALEIWHSSLEKGDPEQMEKHLQIVLASCPADTPFWQEARKRQMTKNLATLPGPGSYEFH